MDCSTLRRKLAACRIERALLEDDLDRLGAQRGVRSAAMHAVQDAVAEQAAQIRALQAQLGEKVTEKDKKEKKHNEKKHKCPCPCVCVCKGSNDDSKDGPTPCRCKSRRRRAPRGSDTDASDSSSQSTDRNLREAMADLAARCHRLVRSHCRDLGVFTAGHKDIPRPTGSSESALLMRCAAVEHLVARALVNYVFVDEEGDRDTDTNTDTDTNSDTEDVVDAAVDAVLAHLPVEVFRRDPATTSASAARRRRTALATALRSLFNEARALWAWAQADVRKQSRRLRNLFLRAELDAPAGRWRYSEDAHCLYGPREDDEDDDDDDEDEENTPFFIVPLFPQTVQYTDRCCGARRRGVLVFAGHALWSRQRAAAAAIREAKAEEGKKKEKKRKDKARARRQREAEAAAEAERERRRWRQWRREHCL